MKFKNLFSVAAVTLLAVLFSNFSGCDKEDVIDSLVGTWKGGGSYVGTFDGKDYNHEAMGTITLRDDETCDYDITVNDKDKNEITPYKGSGKFNVVGSLLTLPASELTGLPLAFNFDLDGDKLTVSVTLPEKGTLKLDLKRQ